MGVCCVAFYFSRAIKNFKVSSLTLSLRCYARAFGWSSFSLSLCYKCFSLSLILCISRRRTKESRVSLVFLFSLETPKGTPLLFFTWSPRCVARNIWSLPWLGVGTGRLWYICVNKHPRAASRWECRGIKNTQRRKERARKSGKRFLYLLAGKTSLRNKLGLCDRIRARSIKGRGLFERAKKKKNHKTHARTFFSRRLTLRLVVFRLVHWFL